MSTPIRDSIEKEFALTLRLTEQGKSATLNYIVAQYVANYNTQFFIIEKGRSF